MLAAALLRLTWNRSALAAACKGIEVVKSEDAEICAALTTSKAAATEALRLANVSIPKRIDSLAFKVACEDEVPSEWAFRDDDADIHAARDAFLEGRHEDAIAKRVRRSACPTATR